ncbi:MAG: HlyC/CorC family transporter [Phycisphaerales bacterium]|nr:HlyC/CorC family transporter [Phycisphaerales bacterium]
MTNPLTWIAFAILMIATYLSALNMALLGARASSIERALEERGRAGEGAWVLARLNDALLATALLRTIARIAFFIAVMLEVVAVGAANTLTWPALLLSAGVTVLLLWVMTSVVAVAVARHAAIGLIVRSLRILHVCVALCLPFTWLAGFLDEAVRRMSGTNPNANAEAEELLRRVAETHREGSLHEVAATMIENVVSFASTHVGEIMTPRTDIDGIELSNDLPTIRQFILGVGHSRIPVYGESLDDIRGVLYVKDLFPYLGEDASDFDLQSILRKPLLVPETKLVRELLADFQRSEVHMAIVVDEYGGTSGLVTIEDILEEIVGEIHDEHEPDSEEEPQLHRLGTSLAEVDGRYYIDELNEALGLGLPEDEDYDTIGGYVVTMLGRIPAVGETVDTPRARFTAIAASETRVDRVGIELLTPVPGSVNGAAK